MKKIIHSVHVHATPRKVYEALTTTDGLSGWWTNNVVVEPRVGGMIRFTFHGDFHPRMKQTTLEQDRRVQWICVGGHDNWQDNTFTFTCDDRNGETMVHFEQTYAQELPDETYGTYNFNWGYYLNSLKQLCETGSGTPFSVPTD